MKDTTRKIIYLMFTAIMVMSMTSCTEIDRKGQKAETTACATCEMPEVTISPMIELTPEITPAPTVTPEPTATAEITPVPEPEIKTDDQEGNAVVYRVVPNKVTGDVYLKVTAHGKEYEAKAAENAYGAKLHVADLDHDGEQEYMVHCCRAASGGDGQYDSAIFKLKDGELKKVFSYGKDDGFFNYFTFTENGTLAIDMHFTDAPIIVKGEPAPNVVERIKEYPTNSWADSFSVFEPFDCDNDGKTDFMTKQYTCAGSHVAYAGTFVIYWQYDGEKDTYVPVDNYMEWFTGRYE